MTTYAHNINRVTFAGTMFGGAEEWSTGFFLGEEGAAAADPTDAAATALLDLWRTFFESANSFIASTYLTTECKINQIQAINGRVLDGSTHYAYPATQLDGAYAAQVYPPQCSLVVTLASDRPRGLASKGRMYIPGVSAAVSANGKITTANRDVFATNVKNFFNGVRAHADIPNTPILAAKGTGVFPELTAQNDYIQTIKVGDVIDTQRRRRNGLVESYKTEILT